MQTKSVNTKMDRMMELIETLNAATKVYEQTGQEQMSNYEWDQLYDELKALEITTGITLSSSPTQNVGYEVCSSLPKEDHATPCLSLDKTKDPSFLKEFLGTQEGILSWKLDGLTVVLTYQDGQLQKAVTRGNGITGEVITQNARMFANVPLTIPLQTRLVVRGEALIEYKDFERINQELPEGTEPYKNPRNLCSGTVRQLNNGQVKDRNVQFVAFALVEPEHPSVLTRAAQLDILSALGFDVVGHILVTAENVEENVARFGEQIQENPFPSDGLVLQINDIAYGKSLGQTSKHPRDSIALKWEDETKETVLRSIHWSASRTGLINPVAVFDPVELEGTTVSRASVHNVSIVEALQLSEGDTITVYKANMIIPQVLENKTRKGTPVIPDHCPVCGAPTRIEQPEDSRILICPNPECGAKSVGHFVHFVCRDAMNIEGLSKETLRKFLEVGILTDLPSIFRLPEHKAEICGMEGFGKKSYENICAAIEKARKTDFQHLLYALGIENVGRTASRLICKTYNYDPVRIMNLSREELLSIPDIGDVIADSFLAWFDNPIHQELIENLLEEVELTVPKAPAAQPLANLTFVVTGSLTHYSNRNALKAQIEALGGKVSGSVSSRTTALINNNLASTSGKNKTAKELGIPIITEEDMIRWMETGTPPEI